MLFFQIVNVKLPTQFVVQSHYPGWISARDWNTTREACAIDSNNPCHARVLRSVMSSFLNGKLQKRKKGDWVKPATERIERSNKTLAFRYNTVPNRIGKAPYLSLLQSFCGRSSFLTCQPNMDISRSCILQFSVHSHHNFSYFFPFLQKNTSFFGLPDTGLRYSEFQAQMIAFDQYTD